MEIENTYILLQILDTAVVEAKSGWTFFLAKWLGIYAGL